jgi:hypothetical protein
MRSFWTALWRWTQSAANPSLARYPLSGKNTGNIYPFRQRMTGLIKKRRLLHLISCFHRRLELGISGNTPHRRTQDAPTMRPGRQTSTMSPSPTPGWLSSDAARRRDPAPDACPFCAGPLVLPPHTADTLIHVHLLAASSKQRMQPPIAIAWLLPASLTNSTALPHSSLQAVRSLDQNPAETNAISSLRPASSSRFFL